MIFTQQPLIINMPHCGTVCTSDSFVIPEVPELPIVVGFTKCNCDDIFIECAFVKDGGLDHENDYASYMIPLLTSGDSISVELFKGCDNKVADINDNTYGEFLPTTQNNLSYVSGFKIDWLLVQQAFGYGLYYIKITKTSLGVPQEIETHQYEVKEYSEERAKGTVKIESIQNGKIINGIDYTGLNWKTSFRVFGFFGKIEMELEKESYISNNRKEKQIQDTIRKKYTLALYNFSRELFFNLVESLLGNQIFITDYNTNFDIYRGVEVVVDEVLTQEHNITKKKYEIVFSECSQGLIKRNYL